MRPDSTKTRLIKTRLLLLGTGALALATLVACGPQQADSTAVPASVPAVTEPTPATPPAPADTPSQTEEALAEPPPMETTDAAPAPDASPEAAEDAVRRYYAAINAKDYATAYALWGNNGAASRQTYEVFAHGYAKTTGVQAQVGKAFGAEGAAGSRYIQVPIDLAATQADGSSRHYRGNFTLRAVMADGATPQQRQWHLDSADLEGYEPAPAKP